MNELISGVIAVLLAVAVVVLSLLGRMVPTFLVGAFSLVLAYYYRAQGFNAGVDYAKKAKLNGQNGQ